MEDKHFSEHEGEGGRVSNFAGQSSGSSMKCTIKGKQLTTVVVLKVYAVASPHMVGVGAVWSPLAHRIYCSLIRILQQAHQDDGRLVATLSIILYYG